MIQRKQTLFLLIAFIINILLFFFPFCEFSINNSDLYKITALGIFSYPDNSLITNLYPVLILLIIILTINLISIFLYKKRSLQLRFNFFNIFLNIGLIVLFFYFILKSTSDENAIISYKISIVIPLISIILYLLAIKFIRSDQNLLKSLDRIR